MPKSLAVLVFSLHVVVQHDALIDKIQFNLLLSFSSF